MNEIDLIDLLLRADAGEVAIDDHTRAAADYRQRCKLIDRAGGRAVMLTRCTGRLAQLDPELAARVPKRWYSLSITFCEPDFGPTTDIDFGVADQIARTLFGDAADFAVATTDTFVPGTVQINLACSAAWQPIPWLAQLPTPAWRYWAERAELIELEAAA